MGETGLDVNQEFSVVGNIAAAGGHLESSKGTDEVVLASFAHDLGSDFVVNEEKNMFEIAKVGIKSIFVSEFASKRSDTSGRESSIANAFSVDQGRVLGAGGTDVGVVSTILAVDTAELGLEDESSEGPSKLVDLHFD